jgi:phage terminase large subunit
VSQSYAGQIKQLRAEVGDLLASHEQTRDLAEYGKYANDPVGFMHDVLRCYPWERQVEIAEAVRDNPRTVVVTANGIGKDFITARIALWWAYARRGMVILTGPTSRQVQQILMREVRRAFVPELPGDLYSLELRVSNDCGIMAFTSDNADKLLGYHHPRLLICMTEGQGVEDDAYEAAHACATGSENRVFVYGNPTKPTGAFYRAAQSDHWKSLRIPASEHPNVIAGREEIPGAISREWVESMREEYGAGSSIYRSRVLAQFPEESVEGLIRRDWLRAAYARHESGEMHDAAMQYPAILALDVARYGPDASVLTVIQGPIVREIITWRDCSLVETAARTVDHMHRLWVDRRLPPPQIVVDEPGLGGGCIDILRANKTTGGVHAFNGAAQPILNDQRFLNLRAESHWKLRELLENNRIALPRDAALEEEALAVEWQVANSGAIQILGKDLIRKAIGRSPDRLDAVVMGLSRGIGQVRKRAAYVTSLSI